MSAATIPVYVQTEVGDIAFLIDWPADDLASVIRLVTTWGVSDDNGQLHEFASGDLLIHDGRVVFRVTTEDTA